MMNKEKTILDLISRCIEGICKCLSVADMVEACTTIPGWDFILNQPQFIAIIQTYINRFQWIDHYLLRIMFVHKDPLSIAEAQHAVLYYKRQEAFLSNQLNYPMPPTVGVNLEIDQTDFFSLSTFEEMNTFDQACRYLLPEHDIRVYNYVIFDLSTTEPFNFALESNRKDNLFDFDVQIYKSRRSPHMMHPINSILSLMKPGQALQIFVVSDQASESLTWFTEIFRQLHQMGNQFLCTNSPIWMTCYVHYDGNEYRNLKHMLQWALIQGAKWRQRIEQDI